MPIIKSILKRKLTILFFILAYTSAILTFSIGNSALTSEKNKMKLFNKNNNKIISFVSENPNKNFKLNSTDFLNILKEYKISIVLSSFIGINGDMVEIVTELKSEGLSIKPDMKEGTYFSNLDFSSDEPIAVISSTLESEDNKYILSPNIKLTTIGSTYERAKKVIVPNKVFFDFFEIDNIAMPNITCVINGEEKEVTAAINKIKENIKKLDDTIEVKVNPYVLKDVNYEASNLQTTSLLLILITIINSISISSLWIEDRKKEIVLRKVVGAKDIDIFKIFLGELVIVSIISTILAFIIQGILAFITNGYLYSLNIKLNWISAVSSFLLAIVVAYLSAIPAFKYLTKIQPAKMLRED
ncbi:MAG: ABC transporter permease [Clostridium chrysemydis]|uniref:ABC transporter permease n=1 Tax=Clostridium chrysemydis TaxID=2665504 RepID=UPI003F3CDB64